MVGWRHASVVRSRTNLPKVSFSGRLGYEFHVLLLSPASLSLWMFASGSMVLGGDIVGWLPSFDLQPNFQGKAFEHHAYSSWSSSVECDAWSFTLLHDALQCPRKWYEAHFAMSWPSRCTSAGRPTFPITTLNLVLAILVWKSSKILFRCGLRIVSFVRFTSVSSSVCCSVEGRSLNLPRLLSPTLLAVGSMRVVSDLGFEFGSSGSHEISLINIFCPFFLERWQFDGAGFCIVFSVPDSDEPSPDV
jgi:hypothetical protein